MDTSNPSELPGALRAFLYSCIDSVDQVELLVWLRRRDAATVREASDALRIPAAVARRHLDVLTARGLLQAQVQEQTAYRYEPVSADLRGYAELLAEHYECGREPVLRFLSSRAARSFADAFKLRRTP